MLSLWNWYSTLWIFEQKEVSVRYLFCSPLGHFPLPGWFCKSQSDPLIMKMFHALSPKTNLLCPFSYQDSIKSRPKLELLSNEDFFQTFDLSIFENLVFWFLLSIKLFFRGFSIFLLFSKVLWVWCSSNSLFSGSIGYFSLFLQRLSFYRTNKAQILKEKSHQFWET